MAILMKKIVALLLMSLLLVGCTKDKTSVDGKKGGAGANGYEITINGTTITMHKEAADIISALGKTKDYYEATSCAFDGLDKQYFYEGYQVETYPTDDKDYISLVYIEKEGIPTKEGVQVGDTAEKVKEVYGTDYKDDFGTMIYSSGKSELKFYFTGDKVSEIEYAAIIK